MISRMVMPKGTSNTPGCFTLPDTEIILVPGQSGVPWRL